MDYTQEFETFWVKFPSRWNKDFQGGSYVKRKKRPAFDKWVKLSPAIRAECLYKLRYIKQAEGGAIRDCVTWLNQRGWEDIEMAAPEPIVSKEKADELLKSVARPGVNINNERNKQLDKLEL